MRSCFVAVLILSLVWPADLFAQQLPVPAPKQLSAPTLRVIALEGDRAVNILPLRIVTAPVVEVRDLNERPVEGATVVFKLPASGPGGFFSGRELTQTTVTDFRGQAGVTGYVANDQPGRFQIEVIATHQNRTGFLFIEQRNSTDAAPREPAVTPVYKKPWFLLGILGGAAGAGAYFALRGPSKLSISPGPVVFGIP